MNTNKQELTNNIDTEMLKYDLEIWKVALDTQMHFNDLLIKMRTTVISIILAVFGAATIALRDINLRAEILGCYVHISIVILVIGLIFLIGQFIIDFFYYFKLLLGAVKFTENLDNKYKKNGLFGLSSSISKSVSHFKAGFILWIYYLIPLILSIFAIYIISCKIVSS